MFNRKSEFSMQNSMTEKYREQYLHEKSKIPEFLAQSDFNKHLQSLDAFVEWKKKNDKLFDTNDKAKELL